MPEGKAYNKRIFKEEQDAHERFNGIPQPAVDALRNVSKEGVAKDMPSTWTYEKLWEMRLAKRSGEIGHFLNEMNYDIYMGIEDDLVAGSIDPQVRCYPDYVPRASTINDYAVKASQAKMRAFIVQDHFFPTVGQAWGAQQLVDAKVADENDPLDYATTCLGTHILAWSHHPDQIHLINKYPNLGGILFWCQTYGGKNCGPTLTMYDENGKIDAEVKECMKLCAHYKIPVMSCHAAMTYEQIYPMAEAAAEAGCNLLWMHAAPWAAMPDRATIKQYKDLIDMGCWLQVDANKVLPSIIWPMIDPNMAMEWMAELGPEHIVPCTDGGQPFFGDPIDCWKMFVRAMIHFGIPKADIKKMIQDNPAEFLYLDEKDPRY